MHQELAPLVVGCTHHLHILVTVAQSLHRSILADRGCAHDGELMDLDHLLHDDLVGQSVTQTPAGHSKGLGEAVDDNSTLLHAGQAGNRDVLLTVGQIGVDLVGDDHQIVLNNGGNQRLQILAAHDGAGGVIGEGDHQRLGLGRNSSLQLFLGQAELVLLLQRNGNRNTVGHGNAGHIGDKARLGVQHLVSGVDDGPQSNVDGLTAAHGNDDFLHRIVGNTDAALRESGDFPAQLGQTGIGGIECLTPGQGTDTLITDMPGGIKVRLANAQRNGVRDITGGIKEPPDTGRLQRHHFSGQQVFSHAITILPSVLISSKSTPSSLYLVRVKWVVVL